MTNKITQAKSALRSVLAHFSPRRRRWQQFLRSLPLDPDQLALPLTELAPGDFIICGSPRTGTTLVSGLLFQPPKIVTVMEPWDGMRMPPAELFASLREEITQTGMLRRGKLDIAALVNSGKIQWQQEGQSAFNVEVDSDFILGVKWPAYWRYIPLMPNTKFLVCLRHPYEVINSFKQIGGRVAQGLQYDIRFNQKLNQELMAATPKREIRRILLYDYIHMRILPHLERDNVFVVRYERWFTEPEQLLQEMGDFLGKPLSSGHVNIRHPGKPSSITEEEKELIKKHCKTAHLLGYTL